MTEDKLEGFKTSCQSCVFAQWIDGVQLENPGCSLDRLSKFIEQGRTQSAEEGYHIIDGICNTCRGPKWLEGIATNADPVSTVLKEIELTVDMVLYSVDDVSNDLDRKIGRAVASCVKQHKILPKKIVIVVKTERISFTSLYATIQELCEPYEIPFQLVRVMEDDADIGRSVEMGIDKCSSQFTAVFDAEFLIPNNLIYRLNEIVNYDLSRLIMVEPFKDYSGLVLSTNAFPLFGKNYNIPIFDKIKEVADQENKKYLIITWGSLWTQR